jgi:hypothetical protein
MSELTREQAIQLIHRLRIEGDMSGSLEQVILRSDAALRTRVAELEVELEECKHQNGISAREMNLEHQLATMTAQLAARTYTWTTEREELLRELSEARQLASANNLRGE